MPIGVPFISHNARHRFGQTVDAHVAATLQPAPGWAAASAAFEGAALGARDVERLGHRLERQAAGVAQFTHFGAERGHLPS